MNRWLPLLMLTVGCATSCATDDPPQLLPPEVAISKNEVIIKNISALIPDKFDRVTADIAGLDWAVVATAEGGVTDNTLTIPLPAPAYEQLCKVARDSYNDYEGYWPAEEASDRDARVAGLKDMIVWRGGEKIGRIEIRDSSDAIVNFHYADRPVALSGHNLLHPLGSRHSFRYEASFNAGWNTYASSYNGTLTVIRTPIAPPPLSCKFEEWTIK